MKYNKRIVDRYTSLDLLVKYRKVFVYDMSATIFVTYPHAYERVSYDMGNRKRRLVREWKTFFRNYEGWKDIDFRE